MEGDGADVRLCVVEDLLVSVLSRSGGADVRLCWAEWTDGGFS